LDLALFLSALMLGLAGVPHCVAMCGPSCAAVAGGASPGSARSLAFHGGRLAGYALAGAVAASSVGALASLAQWSPALRPLWTLAHAAALFLGLWLAWHGRQPAWVEGIGRRVRPTPAGEGGWQRIQGPAKAGAVGAAWVAWPCGLLQSALVVAALANTAAGGAAVMAGFAVVTATGLGLGPWLFVRLSRSVPGGAAASGPALVRWSVRFAGATLAAASAWALGRDVFPAVLAYCFG
jgi:sulfite exporter TauE/SafE